MSHTPDGDLLISGKDRAGKPWSFQLEGKSLALASDAYAADLDRNGINDLILASPTGGNGLAPATHLVTLLFDPSGRPVPFTAEGYYTHGRSGISGLVDLDRDGKADLIFMNFDDGYWITTVYRASGGRWQRVRGRLGRRSYPLYTRFTFRPNHRPVTPRRGRHPQTPDLSNRLSRLRGTLESFQLPEDADPRLRLRTSAGKVVLCQTDYWFSTGAVVVDGPEGRRIAAFSASKEAVAALLAEIKTRKYVVHAYGQRPGVSGGEKPAPALHPELFWASPAPN